MEKPGRPRATLIVLRQGRGEMACFILDLV